MSGLNLVIGANGHMGNNLVRELIKEGEKVRGSVRNLKNSIPFKGLECEIVKADILEKESLKAAMIDVKTVYFTAAVYKSWARDIQKEIIDVNIRGTKNTVEAAAEAGVERFIFVSSTFAANHEKDPIDGEGWNNNYSDPYRMSKTESEKLAWRLAGNYGLSMVSVLPSAMVGPHCYGHLTPSMGLLERILSNQLPIDPDFYFNYVDIENIVKYTRLAALKGEPGKRYILSQEKSISSTQVFSIAQNLFSDVEIPKKVPYFMMLLSANLMSLKSKLTKQPPMMLPSQVKAFYRANKCYDISPAQKDLGYDPLPQQRVIEKTLNLLRNKELEN